MLGVWIFSMSLCVSGTVYYLLGVISDNRRYEVLGGFGFKVGVITALILAYLLLGKGVEPPAKKQFKPEYELEILNQDSVAVKSLSTGRIYKVHFDKVHEALLKDNL